MTAPVDRTALLGMIAALGSQRGATVRDETSSLVELGGLSFREAVMEALLQQNEVAETEAPPAAEAAPDPPAAEPKPAQAAAGVPSHETAVISREAARTGVDPSLLAALRRTENGGPGREFGVLSVPAAGLEAQARVAANTIRNNLARYEQTGASAVDPATGRYTEGFLRFLSSRYAPLGAANDPTNLNRFHAANLIAFYRKGSGADG